MRSPLGPCCRRDAKKSCTSESALVAELQDRREVECTSESETQCCWALTESGMQRLRAARVATSPVPVFNVEPDVHNNALTDASLWELLVHLQREGWVLCRKPSPSQLKRSPLPPIMGPAVKV